MSSNRWSRQLLPTSSNLSAQDRSERRLSRLSPSDFDSILNSDQTIVLAGRDESQLGRAPKASLDALAQADELDEPSFLSSSSDNRISTASNNSQPPLPPPLTTPHSTKQRSIARDSPATVSSPDLAGARRRAQAQLAKQAETKGKATAVENKAAQQQEESPEVEPPPTPTKDHNNATFNVSLSPSRSRTQAAPNLSSPSRNRSHTSPAPPDGPAPIFAKLSVPADLNDGAEPASSRVSTLSSYVHVDRPSEEIKTEARHRWGRDTRYDSVASLALDSSPKRRKPGFGLGGGGGDDDPQKSSFSNTMRKTSRFFRKFGASSTPAPAAKSGMTVSTPNTPISNTFSSAPPPPPVPAVPASYARRSSASRPSASPQSKRIDEASPRKSSIDITIDSPKLSPAAEGTSRERSSHSLSPKENRRRSLSMNSASAAAKLGLGVAGSDRLGAPPAPKRVSSRSEEERLKKELQRWKLDLDGVLGSIGDGVGGISPDLSARSTSPCGDTPPTPALPTPRVDLPTFAPLESAFMGRSISTPPRRPTWNEEWVQGEEPVVTQRSASLPTSSLSPLPPLPLNNAAEESPEPSNISPVPEQPESLPVELLPESSPVELLASPAMESAQQSPSTLDESFPSSKTPSTVPVTLSEGPESASRRHSLNQEGLGLGLGLATITESSHSRDSSFANIDTTPRRPHTADASVPPFIVTKSPSPSTNGGPASPSSTTPKLSNTRKKAVRQSVVAYPIVARTASLPVSRTGSTVSLGSDPSLRRGGHKSTEQALGASDDLSSETIEEKARISAQRCWDEDTSFVEPKKIAEWLGSFRPLNAESLRNYINYFDFTGLRLDLAFRRLCGKLYLKAETQQVDRILAQFSRRFWENNPSAIYGSADVVHAVSYSLLLLNTDLHVVDTDRRMTKNQFVRNTLSAINMQADDPEVDTTPALLFRSTTRDDTDPVDNVFGGDASTSRKSLDQTMSRNSSVVSWSASTPGGSPKISRDSPHHSHQQVNTLRNESSATVNSSGSRRSVDVALESTLKDMYIAIKAQPIFQPLSSTLSLPESHSRSSVSLTPSSSPYATWNGVNRSASRRSATSTISGSSAAFKRSSVRGFGNFLGTNSSIELGRSSSPTPSAATSISDDNFSTAYGASHHHVPTIGFANSLSHTIIREQQEDDGKSDDGVSVTDEELALLGAPWAKEGLLHRKHYWESVGKRAKEKNWLQVFIVVSAGELRMFRFDGGGSSRGGGGGMGGGDWTSSAQSVGEVSLTHALCSAMPPPGYSRDRPHCFVLTLPDGGSYFFQAGTQDLVGEWVSTCNYWSARLSKEPLPGGVSNMEYGWNRVTPSKGDEDREETMSIRSSHSRMSYQPSLSGFGGERGGSNSNDRIFINDWKPPNAPLGASTLSEDAQLENLKRHVAIVKAELAHHNTLRAPMTKLYSSRSVNSAKSAANWERKSQHLLAEIVKYQTYIEALTSAVKLRALKRGQKEVAHMLESADDDDDVVISPTDGPGEGAFAMPSASTVVSAEMEDSDESDSGTQQEVGGEEEPTEERTRRASTLKGRPANLSLASVASGGTSGDDVFLDAQAGSTPTELGAPISARD